jgi:hypothetical protein
MVSPPLHPVEPDINTETLWQFIGLDLAPNDTLETGVAVLDRERNLTFMDKVMSDREIAEFIASMDGPVAVVIDLPKTLGISSKWRLEQVRMTPRLRGQGLSERPNSVYDLLKNLPGVHPFFCPTQLAKMRYELNIPYRTRSPQGSRALHTALKLHLQLKQLPTNLPAIAILEAMIGAYAAWTLFTGEEGEHYRFMENAEGRLYLDPLDRVSTTVRRRMRRRRGRRF